MNLVPISNDLLQDSSFSVDALVRDDMVRSMSLREDIAFIRDTGAANTPRGLRFWAPAANVNLMTPVPTLATITDDLFASMLLLENANIPLDRAGWMFSPRTKSGLMRIRDASGNFAFKDEMLRGTLLGFRYETTTQIPNNLDASGGGLNNESEVYFVDFSSVIIAESSSLQVSVFEGGTFDDGAGNIVSGISTDQTLIRSIARHDLGCRNRGLEVSVTTGITWGI